LPAGPVRGGIPSCLRRARCGKIAIHGWSLLPDIVGKGLPTYGRTLSPIVSIGPALDADIRILGIVPKLLLMS
jgi:hypothetical protein